MRLIDADALEELFRETISHIAKNPKMSGNLEHMVRASAMVIEMINDAPTIEPQKWISCDERLPEDYIRVLTTNSKIGAWEVDINSRNVAGWIYSSDPVAWMPLPEPYKEEEE